MQRWWGDRLDPRGKHLTRRAKRDLDVKWDSPHATGEDGWVDGESVRVNDAQNKKCQLKLSVGDAVYMTASESNDYAELALVIDLFQDKQDGFWMGIKYFQRPEFFKPLNDDDDGDGETVETHERDDGDGETVETHERELYLQSERHNVEFPIETVELVKPFVSMMTNPADLVDAPHTFFYRKLYDSSNNELLDPPPPPPAAAAPPDGEGGAEPAPEDPPPPPGAEGEDGETQPAKAPRRNKDRERIVALEEQVEALTARVGQVDVLVAQVAELKASLLRTEADLNAKVDPLAARVQALAME